MLWRTFKVFFSAKQRMMLSFQCWNALCLFLPTIVPLERLPAISQSVGLQHGVGPELVLISAWSTNSLISFLSDSHFWMFIHDERSTLWHWKKSLCLQVCNFMSAGTVLVGWCQISEARDIRLLFKHPIIWHLQSSPSTVHSKYPHSFIWPGTAGVAQVSSADNWGPVCTRLSAQSTLPLLKQQHTEPDFCTVSAV